MSFMLHRRSCAHEPVSLLMRMMIRLIVALVLTCHNLSRTSSMAIFQGQRIVPETEAPWFAPLMIFNQEGQFLYLCGGILIAEQYVLTSASCLLNVPPDTDRYFHIGHYCRNFANNCGQRNDIVRVRKIWVPRTYRNDTEMKVQWRSDIGLALLNKVVRKVPYATPHRELPANNETTGEGDSPSPSSLRLVAKGYRTYNVTSETGEMPFYVQRIDQDVVHPTSQCEEARNAPVGEYGPSAFCLRRSSNGGGACPQDFGSPAVSMDTINGTNTAVVHGILSAHSSAGCYEGASPQPPDIYTRVSSFYTDLLFRVVCGNSRKRPPSWCPCSETRKAKFELNPFSGLQRKCSWLRDAERAAQYCRNTKVSNAYLNCPVTCGSCL